MKDNIVPLVCAFLVAALAGLALCKGVNGKVMGIAFLILGGIGGFTLKNVFPLWRG